MNLCCGESDGSPAANGAGNARALQRTILDIMMFIPAVGVAEHVRIQRVVPFETQVRVFWLAAAIVVFMVAPLAEFWIIPTWIPRVGQGNWGWLLGEGDAGRIAVAFLDSGIASILPELGALCTRFYRWLSIVHATAVESKPLRNPRQRPFYRDLREVSPLTN